MPTYNSFSFPLTNLYCQSEIDGAYTTIGTFNTEERKNNMDVRDKICDKCGKRYSTVDMRVEKDDGYVDKTCYLDNKTPIENYPKLYHSTADKKNVGRVMDLCSECAEKLKKFAGEQ